MMLICSVLHKTFNGMVHHNSICSITFYSLQFLLPHILCDYNMISQYDRPTIRNVYGALKS